MLRKTLPALTAIALAISLQSTPSHALRLAGPEEYAPAHAATVQYVAAQEVVAPVRATATPAERAADAARRYYADDALLTAIFLSLAAAVVATLVFMGRALAEREASEAAPKGSWRSELFEIIEGDITHSDGVRGI